MRNRTSNTIMAGASALVIAMTTASAAQAQTVIMRKAIPIRIDRSLVPSTPATTPTQTPTPGGTPTPGTTPTPTPTATPQPGDVDYYSWVVTDWKQAAGACGAQGTETRDVACRNTLGVAKSDDFCTGNGSGPKPVTSQDVTLTDSCGYSWNAPQWPTVSGTCGTTEQTRIVSCLRTDGTSSDLCNPNSKPATTQSVVDHTGCGYSWSTSAYSTPSTTCGTATQTRSVSCLRTDGTIVDDALCSTAGTRPDTSQTTDQTSGCATSWKTGDWSTPAACGAVTETRTVTCQTSAGQTVADAQCTDAKPATTQDGTSYSTCPASYYTWKTGDFGSPTTTCGDATLTRTVQCVSQDGRTVADSFCTDAKPATTEQSHVTSSCTTSWQAAATYDPPVPACGPTIQNRTVTCLRSDGQAVADSACTDSKPVSQQATTDYSTCSFGWAATAWSAYSSTCGDATRTRAVTCQRSDGTTAPDGSCDVSTKPDASESSYQTTTCGFSWKTGDYGASAPACGASTQTRTVTCLRDDGQTVDDGQCAVVGAKPSTTQPSTDYSTCTFSWTTTGYGAPSTTCGTAIQTRSVTCTRSDNTTAADASCSAVGAKPDTQETTQQTSSCSYVWTPSAYGAAVSACGASTHSRSVPCVRSDGTTVADSFCTGTPPVSSEAVNDYTGCTFTWNVGQWQGSSTVCGSSVQQTRSVVCQRSDLTNAPDSSCATAKPAATQTITDYSGCGYTWSTVNGTWSGTCSSTATRTNTVTCKRSDGTTVADGFCTTTKPATTDTGNYASCSYTPTYSTTYGTCTTTSGTTAGTQTAPLISCARSDGTDATAANVSASYAYCAANSPSKSCTVPTPSDYDDYEVGSTDTYRSDAGSGATSISTAASHHGASSLQLVKSGAVAAYKYPYSAHYFPTLAGATYKVSCWVLHAGTGTAPIAYLFNNGSQSSSKTISGTAWTQVSFTFTGTGATWGMSVVNGDAASVMYVDEFAFGPG